jgi:hypothetical protein
MLELINQTKPVEAKTMNGKTVFGVGISTTTKNGALTKCYVQLSEKKPDYAEVLPFSVHFNGVALFSTKR